VSDGGVAIELIQTDLSEEAIWGTPKANSVIYPEEAVPDRPASRGRRAVANMLNSC
jgi:hypothetical protein